MEKEEFKALIDKYLNGSATGEETALLFRQHSRLVEKYPEWNDNLMGDEATVKARLFARIAENVPKTNTIKPLWWRSWKFAAAATVLVFAGIALRLFYQQISEIHKPVSAGKTPHRIAGSSRVEQLNLTDGTHIWLGKNSRLTYPEKFADSARLVSLSGQAYFEVSPNLAPFVIKTGELETRVLGTRFVIKAFANEPDVNVAVVEGKVRVNPNEGEAKLVTGYQQVTYNKTDHRLAQQPIHDIAELLAWTGKKITYRNTRLADVTADLSQIYGVNVIVKKELAGCRIHADFLYSDSPDQVLQFLAASLNGTVTKTKAGYTLTGKGCN